jgi:hypothetical protein
VAVNGHVTSSRQSERLDTGRTVERFGHRRAPIDHQRIEFFIRDRQTSHVVLVDATPLIGGVVDATEEERLVADGQLVQAMQRRTHDHVTFDEVARATHVRHRGAVTEGPGLVTHVIEGGESEIEEDLFLFDLTLVGHPRPHSVS